MAEKSSGWTPSLMALKRWSKVSKADRTAYAHMLVKARKARKQAQKRTNKSA